MVDSMSKSVASASKNSSQSHADNILDAWTALEALSPQTYKAPKDLLTAGGSIVSLDTDQEPWFQRQEARPNTELYYIVYLGSVDLGRATEKLLSAYEDDRIEGSRSSGQSVLGLIILDQHGIPLPEMGLALSSFGWAYGRALQGNLHELKSWEASEEMLKEGLEQFIYQQDEDGNTLPLTVLEIEEAYDWLVKHCEIPQDDCTPPSFAIQQYQSSKKGAPSPAIINSFLLEDIQRAKHNIQSGTANPALCAYLGVTKPKRQHDLLKSKAQVERALQPQNMPLGRWPGKGRHALVLLQQVAVNLARQELKDGGLFSVNGPPGTGKTTLLRDMVASVLVDRALALSAFEKTDDAFEHAGEMKLGNGFVHLYRLDESLRGHEIVVASSNNKAVENISKELPLRDQIAEDIKGLNYFKTISNALSDDNQTWGNIAAALGNSTNRNNFTQKAWWDDESGLKAYFYSITKQLELDLGESGKKVVPKIVAECDPPASDEEAKLRWERARKRFATAIKKSEEIRGKAQAAYKAYQKTGTLQKKINKLQARCDEQAIPVAEAQEVKQTLTAELRKIKSRYDKASTQKQQFETQKPNILKRLFARATWLEWKAQHQLFVDHLQGIQTIAQRAKAKRDAAIEVYQQQVKLLSDLHKALEEARTAQQNTQISQPGEEAICGGKLVTAELWAQSHEAQQAFTPNYTAEAQRIRDDVFIAAIKLHKAFIDASAKQVRQNLSAYFYCLGSGRLPEDKKELLPHLWSTAFLLTPVISTAFASVGRMFKDLPVESIGWLLIDEAGQATPQAAVGAIARAKRVMSVGDPLQIEPVSPLPAALVEGLSKHLGVESNQWMAPNASVQTLSDNANPYGAAIARDLSKIRIGAPLLVHRRCEDPMFSIVNRMAYNGLMVHATPLKESVMTSFFNAKAKWFDVQGSVEDKWCEAEGEQVTTMLLSAFETFGAEADIFVISPFRIVAERMRGLMRQQKKRLTAYGINDPESWIQQNIGTVHTFQGKEAQTVILLLGAPSPEQQGARAWATASVNLLNVAVSRAKQNFYVVGNRECWAELGHMKIIAEFAK